MGDFRHAMGEGLSNLQHPESNVGAIIATYADRVLKDGGEAKSIFDFSISFTNSVSFPFICLTLHVRIVHVFCLFLLVVCLSCFIICCIYVWLYLFSLFDFSNQINSLSIA